jgi:hypothetical protein
MKIIRRGINDFADSNILNKTNGFYEELVRFSVWYEIFENQRKIWSLLQKIIIFILCIMECIWYLLYLRDYIILSERIIFESIQGFF